jgi:hypothetical protein
MRTLEEIEKLSQHFAYAVDGQKEGDQSSAFGYKMGYFKCQEDNIDKKYTLDDMKKACAIGIDIVNKEGENNFQPFEDLINSLNKEK